MGRAFREGRGLQGEGSAPGVRCQTRRGGNAVTGESDRLADLVESYLAGELSAREGEVLAEELRASTASCARFWQIAQEVTLLRSVLQEARGELVAEEFGVRDVVMMAQSAPAARAKTAFSTRRVALALAASVAILLAGSYFAFQSLDQPAGASGNTVGLNLRSGDVVRAPMGETVTIAYKGEKSWLQLAGGSSLRIEGDLKQKQARLLSGSVLARTSHQADGRSFRITTQHAEMTAVGTIFSAAVDSGATRLSVQEGAVFFMPVSGGRGERIERGVVAIVKVGQSGVAVPGRVAKRHSFPDLKLGGYGLSGVASDGNDVLAFMGNGVNGNMTPAICRIDGRTGKVLTMVEAPEMKMGSGYGAAAWDGKYFWGAISNNIPAAVDLETGKVVRRLAITGKKDGSPLNWLAFDADADSLWVIGGWKGDDIYRIDSTTGEVISTRKISIPGWSVGRLAKHGNSLILGEGRGKRICKVDLVTGVIVGEYTMTETLSNGDIAVGKDRNIWMSEWTRNSVALVEGE
ncbi:MAG: hypothetical protein C0404_11115 [Verrucomicrobia bacterium]|nr:hypothetical protein [Verrucomicrobiota bacterium]